jgi:hypothetical protein
MNKYAIIGAMVLVVIGGLWVGSTRIAKAPGPVACTQEAKLCPDGSYVSRTGPNCEFAVCPVVVATSTTGVGGGDGRKACTMEAKLCSDGSYVSRTGPNCEFTSCPTTIAPYNSAVRGTVLLGPTCPVERIPPDPACAEKPYATTITVSRTGSSSTFATGKSDAAGAFSFSLPPGSYTLVASGGTMLPRCNPTDVTVGPNVYATTTISCDTGIR